MKISNRRFCSVTIIKYILVSVSKSFIRFTGIHICVIKRFRSPNRVIERSNSAKNEKCFLDMTEKKKKQENKVKIVNNIFKNQISVELFCWFNRVLFILCLRMLQINIECLVFVVYSNLLFADSILLSAL